MLRSLGAHGARFSTRVRSAVVQAIPSISGFQQRRYLAAAPSAPQTATTTTAPAAAQSPAGKARTRPPPADDEDAEPLPALDPLPENERIVEVTAANFQSLISSQMPSILVRHRSTVEISNDGDANPNQLARDAKIWF
jgi:hypothetical protein